MAIRVVFVLPSFAGGGAERVMISLAGGLPRETFETSFVVLSSEGARRHEVPGHVNVVDLGIAQLRHALLPLFRTIAGQQPDIVISTMGYLNLGILLGGRRATGGAGLIVREANMPEATINQFRPRAISRLAYRLLYRRSDAVVCNAQRVAHALAATGVDARKTSVIPNPVNVENLRDGTSPNRQPGTGRRFVSAGRLTRQKGFDRLIPLMRKMAPEDHLTILGEGPDRSVLTDLIRSNGLEENVSLPGYNNSPYSLIAGADAFLMPSRWEGMPNAALEALALGTPVIASAESGGLPELCSEVPKGALTIAEQPEAFGSAMQHVSSEIHDNLRPSLLPERFAIGAVLQAYADLIERTVAAR